MLRTLLPRTFSRDHLARDVRTVALALVVSSMVMATPSIAARLTNADSVDGKSAVGAGASIAQRKGKLVATNRKGRLPSNIITKAPNADRLDGLDSTALVTVTGEARAGVVQRGTFAAWGGGAGSFAGESITLRQPLASPIPNTRLTVIPTGGAFTAECPAQGAVVPVGWACLYEQGSGSRNLNNIYDPASSGGAYFGIGRSGFGFYIDCTAAACWSYGTWAIKAPQPLTMRPSGPRGATPSR